MRLWRPEGPPSPQATRLLRGVAKSRSCGQSNPQTGWYVQVFSSSPSAISTPLPSRSSRIGSSFDFPRSVSSFVSTDATTLPPAGQLKVHMSPRGCSPVANRPTFGTWLLRLVGGGGWATASPGNKATPENAMATVRAAKVVSLVRSIKILLLHITHENHPAASAMMDLVASSGVACPCPPQSTCPLRRLSKVRRSGLWKSAQRALISVAQVAVPPRETAVRDLRDERRPARPRARSQTDKPGAAGGALAPGPWRGRQRARRPRRRISGRTAGSTGADRHAAYERVTTLRTP